MDKKPCDNKLGDSGPAVEGIRELATKPDVFNVLPYRHNYTPDGRYILSSMFIPCYRNAMFDDGVEYIDKRGWCNLERAKNRFEQERIKKASDPKALLIYKAEYCFTIEEALIQRYAAPNCCRPAYTIACFSTYSNRKKWCYDYGNAGHRNFAHANMQIL